MLVFGEFGSQCSVGGQPCWAGAPRVAVLEGGPRVVDFASSPICCRGGTSDRKIRVPPSNCCLAKSGVGLCCTLGGVCKVCGELRYDRGTAYLV